MHADEVITVRELHDFQCGIAPLRVPSEFMGSVTMKTFGKKMVRTTHHIVSCVLAICFGALECLGGCELYRQKHMGMSTRLCRCGDALMRSSLV